MLSLSCYLCSSPRLLLTLWSRRESTTLLSSGPPLHVAVLATNFFSCLPSLNQLPYLDSKHVYLWGDHTVPDVVRFSSLTPAGENHWPTSHTPLDRWSSGYHQTRPRKHRPVASRPTHEPRIRRRRRRIPNPYAGRRWITDDRVHWSQRT